jgi:hypothetical protein
MPVLQPSALFFESWCIEMYQCGKILHILEKKKTKRTIVSDMRTGRYKKEKRRTQNVRAEFSFLKFPFVTNLRKEQTNKDGEMMMSNKRKPKGDDDNKSIHIPLRLFIGRNKCFFNKMMRKTA